MAKKTPKNSSDRGRGSSTSAPDPRTPGFGGVDVVVIVAMAAVSVAVGVGLHLQGELGVVISAAMAAALFSLLAFLHHQRVRIRRLGAPDASLTRREPVLRPEIASEAALDIASSKLAATAAAMRAGEHQPNRATDAAFEPALDAEDGLDGIQDHGWGEPAAVDALVRQYAQELDRGPPKASQPAFTRKLPRPALRESEPIEPAAGPVEAPESALAAAVRKAADGAIEIHLQPVVAFADRKARMYEVFPKILDANGNVLGPDDYRAEAEKLELSLSIERMALIRCCTIQRKLSEKGRASYMIFRLSSAAIRDRAFLQRLVADIRPDPLLADLIVFEIDQSEIEQGDGAERENMEFLGSAGFRFSLGRAETLALEVEELVARRIGFVRVTPAILNAEQNPTAVSELRNSGIETIVTAIVREEDVRVGRAFGLVLGQGPLFSEAKPLRADVAGPGPEPVRAAPKRKDRTRAA